MEKKLNISSLKRIHFCSLFIFFIIAFNPVFSQINSDNVIEDDLKYFCALKSGENIKIKWSTATELNKDYYVLEKSIDGNSFKVIAIKDVDSTSIKTFNYTLVDNHVTNLVNFYRLKQIGTNGEMNVLDEIKFDYRFSNVVSEIVSRTDMNGMEVNGNYRGMVLVSYSNGKTMKEIQ